MKPSQYEPFSLAIFAMLLISVSLSTAQEEGKKSIGPPLPPCIIDVDFSTTENALRSSILKGDVYRASAILRSNESFSLAAGLTYSDEFQCAILQSRNRGEDPDIVAIQALALNAEETGETAKLARITVASFGNECACSLFTPQESDQMERDFKQVLDDPKQRQLILEYGGGIKSVDSYHDHDRRLLSTSVSPTNSFVCAFCDPRPACNPMHWC